MVLSVGCDSGLGWMVAVVAVLSLVIHLCILKPQVHNAVIAVSVAA